jgi:hypothetical protein
MKKLLFPLALALTLTPELALARSISFKDAGLALWIFIIIGAGIILLQLIPATLLFFSFIGTSIALTKKEKVAEEAIEGVKEVG